MGMSSVTYDPDGSVLPTRETSLGKIVHLYMVSQQKEVFRANQKRLQNVYHTLTHNDTKLFV